MSASEIEEIETQGDALEFVAENPEQAIVLNEEGGPVWFVHEEDSLGIYLQWGDEGEVETAPDLGHGHRLDADLEIVDRDDVPV